MTLARRIIPCLDTDGERVVKGVQFFNLRDAGDPAAAGVQELTDEIAANFVGLSQASKTGSSGAAPPILGSAPPSLPG